VRAPRYQALRPASAAATEAKRANPSRDTRPELLLRRRLWAMGLRYRLHLKGLPGRPDLVFPGAKVAIFVDGDFWHGRNWPERKARLASGHNAAYWQAKIEYNMVRDAENTDLLRAGGWRVLRIWEGDIRSDPDAAARAIAALVRGGVAEGTFP
jgi:DNA mismatch endonuclease (patch repair protein)